MALGARLARPGEFSERAFLNGKIDLMQAEAIADLIAAADTRAARAARRALEGVFSARVDGIGQSLLALRVHVEAAIDLPTSPSPRLAANRSACAWPKRSRRWTRGSPGAYKHMELPANPPV